MKEKKKTEIKWENQFTTHIYVFRMLVFFFFSWTNSLNESLDLIPRNTALFVDIGDDIV